MTEYRKVMPGMRVRQIRSKAVERSEVGPDLTGAVTDVTADAIRVRLDRHLDLLDEWDNELIVALEDDNEAKRPDVLRAFWHYFAEVGTRRPLLRSKAEVTRAVIDELNEMFVRLADRWDLKTGDEDPIDAHYWEEQTVPAIIEYAWQWYDGNQARGYVTVVLEVPAEDVEGIDQALASGLPDDVVIAGTYPGDLVTDPERQS